MFDDYFEVFLADTPESKAINYSIRYQVYCEEMGFENKDDFPLEQEYDEFDQNSEHFIVRHRQTGHWVGALRLIFRYDQPLPIEKTCDLNEVIGKSICYNSVELSRLCLIKEIRRRFNDFDPPHGITNDQEEIKETDNIKLLNNRRINRSIIWGILNAASEYCYFNKIPNWYFMTTPALVRILKKGGFEMSLVGEPCYHRGERHPYQKDVFEAYKNESWRIDYKNGFGYRNYSELKDSEAMSVAA